MRSASGFGSGLALILSGCGESRGLRSPRRWPLPLSAPWWPPRPTPGPSGRPASQALGHLCEFAGVVVGYDDAPNENRLCRVRMIRWPSASARSVHARWRSLSARMRGSNPVGIVPVRSRYAPLSRTPTDTSGSPNDCHHPATPCRGRGPPSAPPRRAVRPQRLKRLDRTSLSAGCVRDGDRTTSPFVN
jgi:hypothetical protein